MPVLQPAWRPPGPSSLFSPSTRPSSCSPLNFCPVKTPISSNTRLTEDTAARIQPGRDPESWARELPAPLPAEEVEAACEELLSVPVGERREVLHRRAGQHDAAGRIQIVAALVDQGYAHRHSDPHLYARIAQVANQCAYRYLCVPAELRPASRQLRAGALGFLANAYRILGRFAPAEQCWRRMGGIANFSELPALLLSLFCEMEASLARDRRQFGRATVLLEKAQHLAADSASPADKGRVFLILAKVRHDLGDAPAALQDLSEALSLLPESLQTPGQAVAALHNLVYLLLDLEQAPRAARLFLDYAWLYSEIDDSMSELRGRWLLGNVLRELGSYGEAVEHLRLVFETFVDLAMPYEASLAGLELALAYAAQHREYQVLTLARELYPVFTAHGVPREATMALLEFVEAAERYQARTELISGVIHRLRHPDEPRLNPS